MAVIYNTNYTHNSNSYLTLAVARSAKKLWGEENVVVADNMNLLEVAATHEHEVLTELMILLGRYLMKILQTR